MIAPLARIACCLLGIAAAGAPLVYFTSAPEPQAVAAPAAEAAASLAELPTLLRYTDAPAEICLRHEGRELCRISPEGEGGKWRGKLLLPVPAEGEELELEVEAEWTAPRVPSQAITLELTPAQLPARSDTQWSDPGGKTLHSIYTFKW